MPSGGTSLLFLSPPGAQVNGVSSGGGLARPPATSQPRTIWGAHSPADPGHRPALLCPPREVLEVVSRHPRRLSPDFPP